MRALEGSEQELAEDRVGQRNLVVGDARIHTEGWKQRNLAEKQACPLCADSQGFLQW